MSKKHQPESRKGLSAVRPAYAELYSASSRLLLLMRVAGFLLLAVVLLSWMAPFLRVWGMHHYAFLPFPLSILLAALSFVLLTPLGGRFVGFVQHRFPKLAHRSALLWAVAAMVAFYALRVSVPLLGDSSLWIKELSWIGMFESRGQHVPNTRWLMRKEPFELGLHELVFRGVYQLRPREFPALTAEQKEAALKKRQAWMNSAAASTYVGLSVLAGGLLVYLSIRFARKRLVREQRTPFLLLLLSGCGMQMFFGYVENYSWMSLAIVATLLAGIDEAFEPRRFPVKTVVAFLLAVGFHLLSIFLLPAVLLFVFLKMNSRRAEGPTAIRRWFWVVLGGCAILGFAGYVWVEGWKGWISIMPLVPSLSKDGYSILEGRHLLDLLNLFMLSAFAPAMVLAGTIFRKSEDKVAWIQDRFLAMAAIGGGGLAFVFNPNLGMARDWDVVTAALWPLVVWAAWRLATSDLQAMRPHIIAAIAGIALAAVVPYMLIQANTKSSLKRFETLLHLDKSRSAYGWENLATYYEDHGDMENRIRCWKEALNVEDNPRYQVNIGIAYRLKGDLEQSEKYLMEGAKRNPKFAYQLSYLGMEWAKKGRLDVARSLVRKALELDPDDKNASSILLRLDTEIARRDSLSGRVK